MVRRYFSRQFASLGEYNYRVFFIGQSISLIGTWMQTIGQAWLVLQITHSPTALGTVTLLQFLPFTLLSLFGGVVADRLPKRKTLVLLQSFALCQAVVLVALVASDVVELWHIYCLAVLLGTTNAIERPVRQSFFSELVGRDRLVNAVALNSSILNVARVLGPALGGVMIALVGVEGTFAFNAFSFSAVLVGYGLMRPDQFHAKRTAPSTESIGSQLLGGLRYALHTRKVIETLALVAVIGVFGYNLNVTVPLIAEFVLKVGPGRFGLLTSCLGAGSFVSAFAIAGLGVQSTRTLFLGAFAFSVLFILTAFSRNYLLTAGLLALLGASGVALMTVANTSLQIEAPEEYRGRMISLFVLLQAGSTPFGGVLTGMLSDAFGVQTAMATLGFLCVIGVTVTFAIHHGHVAPLEAGESPPGNTLAGQDLHS